jgi:phosphatidylinositol N-acetylglucosaminyltransferase subunit C
MVWQKKLFIKQSFPDNYVDGTFLSEMKKNVNVKLYSEKDLFLGACYVHQHWSSVFLYLILFGLVYRGKCSTASLHLLNNLLLGGIYVCWMAHVKFGKLDQQEKYAKKQVAKAAILLIMALLGLTPVLKTLTGDISTDTIFILSIVLFLVNLIFHNYGTEASDGKPNPIALNASVFGSVLLVSRFSSRGQVFGLLSLGVVWFSLFPIARSYIGSLHYPKLHLGLTFFIGALTLLGFKSIHHHLGWAYLILSAFLLIICPLWYKRLQRYKNNIHGPWDEAKI